MGFSDPNCAGEGESCLQNPDDSQSFPFEQMYAGNAFDLNKCSCLLKFSPNYYLSTEEFPDIFDQSTQAYADEPDGKFVHFICEECVKNLSLPIVDKETWDKEYKIAKEKEELEAEQTSLLDERKEINRQLSSIRYKLKKLNKLI